MADKTISVYYGSQLNKFIDDNCRHDMTAMNIDLIIYRAYNKHIRIIESKHTNEKIGIGQLNLLKKLSEQNKFSDCEFEVLIIYGDEPYNDVVVHNLTKDEEYHLNKNQLIKYLNFEFTPQAQ